MLLVPPNSHPHSSSHTGPSCVDQVNNHSSSSSSSSPGHPGPPSPPIVIKQQPHSPPLSPTNSTDLTVTTGVPNGQPHPHMSGLSEAHYPPVSTASASSQPVVSGRSPQAPPAPLSAPGTPAPTTPTPVTTRPSSGGSASGGSAPPVTTNSISSVGGGVAGGLNSAAGGGTVTTGSGGTGGNSTAAGTGGLPSAMPVPGPSVTPSGGSSGQLPQHHPLLGYVPHGANKILSRNINGTRESGGSVGDKKNTMVTVTSNPSNESELQLYRVLQRANLLNYYDTFISQGDDVQQLCEAGEEEFLEIMALVGMASKPLHVRRLQKALQEWVSNPDSARTMIPAEAMKARELYPSVPQSSASAWGNSMGPTNNPRPTAPYHNQNEGLFLMPIKSPAPAPTSGMPPQLDAFNILSSLTTSYRQHHQQPQSSNITQSPRGARIPPVAAAAAAAVAAAAPHTAPYQRPQPYPSPENLTARKSPPTGGIAPQPGSVSPTDYRRVLEAAWALRAAGQQDPRSSPPGGKISPPGAMNNRTTWPSTMSPPSSNRSPGHHTDTLHNSSESQPFLPGTPVPWFPFLVPVNKL